VPQRRRGFPEQIGYRDRALLPRLGASLPSEPVLLDTNVFINALTQRNPPLPRVLLASLTDAFVAAPTRAELSWLIGRLDSGHPGTVRVVAAIEGAISHIDPAKVLVPTDADWLAAGTLAGRAARATAGGAKTITTAADRQELISDAITAILARSAGFTVITEDADFDILARLAPGLSVLFYDRAPPPA
jgi:predicted nucleic acid-binding protein